MQASIEEARNALKMIESNSLNGESNEISQTQQRLTSNGLKGETSQRVQFSRISSPSKSKRKSNKAKKKSGTSRVSRSSTMPGFAAVSNRQRMHEKEIKR